jgi:hypothetical protein
MTEQKAAKKAGRARRIFSWIGWGVFALLLVVAIYFRVPWKVVVLFLGLPLTLALVPKRIREWITWSAAAACVAIIIWVFLPNDNEGWRPYTFDEELAALEAKYAIPDEQNAAAIYNQLFEVPILDQNEPEFFAQSKPPSLQLFWLSHDHPKTAAWLQKHRATIAKLLDAAQMQRCQFTITGDSLADLYPMHPLAKMRQYAQMLVAQANNDIAEGRIDEGLEKCAAALRMANHLNQQPVMLDLLVGYAIEALAIRQLQRFIVSTDITEGHLQTVERVLDEVEHDWSSDISRVLEYDRLWVKNALCSLAFEVNQKGKVRLSRDPVAYWRSQHPEMFPPITYWQSKLTKARILLAWLFMPTTPQARAKIIDRSFKRYFAMTKPDYDWGSEPKTLISVIPYIRYTYLLRFNYRRFIGWIASMSEESYYAQRELYLRGIANKRGTELLIALRRYKNNAGRWPQSLHEVAQIAPAEVLTDPVNHGSFVYKLTDDSFTLYSRGKNNIDEAGVHNADLAIPLYGGHSSVKVKEDDILIWPPRGRKTKKEDANAE